MERSAGSASIRIRPDASRFVADLKRDLASKQAEFVMKVSADTGQARADIDRFRQLEQRDGIGLGVDVSLDNAQRELAAFRARQRIDDIDIKVSTNVGAARRDVAELTKHLDSFRRSDVLRLNLGAAGISGLPAMAAGLAEVAASLQQVAQAGLAIPGVLAGAGASISTLVLGLSGIKDAWDAVSQASESAGTDQQAQARASAAASNNLRNSLVDEANARKDVARATRDAAQELRDLRIEQRGGMIDESRAVLEAQKAREDLMRGNYSDVRDAQLRVLEADQRVIEVRNRNTQTAERLTEANTKGVQGSDQVVAANERLVRSQQQVADAQAAVADSGSAVSAAQAKANQAMEALGPNAQEVVRTLLEMKPAFQELRNSVSEPLLAGKAEEFKQFFAAVTPTLQSGLGGIAQGWNQNITALFGAVSSQEGKGLLDRILGNTADAQGRMTAAMQPLVDGIGTLTAAGTDALPRMADGLTAVLERFRDFIVEADEDGRLEEWINDGLDGLTNLGNSVLNVGKSFTAITEAAAAGGGRTFLEWLSDATGRLQTFLNSTEGQAQMQEFFRQGREMFEQWRPILEDIPGLLKGIYDGASTYIGGLTDVLNPITSFLSEHPGLVETAAAAYFVFQTAKVLGPLGVLSDALGRPGTGKAGRGGVGILGKLALAAGLLELLDGSPTTNQQPAAGPPPAELPTAPGQVDTGELPAGQSTPFQNVPGAGITPDAVGQIAAGAGVGGAAFGTPGAIAGAFLTSPDVPAETRTRVEKDFAEIVTAIPKLNDQNLKGYADIFGVSVDDLRKMSRDELYQRFLIMAAKPGSGYDMGGFVPPAAPPPAPPQAPPDALDPSFFLGPHFESGGPTHGPRHQGFLAMLHGQEWVHNADTVQRYGPDVMAALTRGKIDPATLRSLIPHFDEGTDPDLYGPANTNPALNNPAAPAGTPHTGTGAAPGPALIAPNPTAGGGGLSSVLGQIAAGAQSPINNAANLFGSLSPGQQTAAGPVMQFGSNLLGSVLPGFGGTTGGRGMMPGLAGLFQAGGDPGLTQQWMGQTGQWLANWGANTLLSFGQTLLDGVFGFFGVGNLLQHPIVQGIGQTTGHLANVGMSFANTPAAGDPRGGLTLSPDLLSALYGTGNGTAVSPAAARAIEFAQTHAVGQKYVYGGTGAAPEGEIGGYDCSGIASSIYAAAKGLPPGTRYFTTESDFEALGFKPGTAPGALNIGVVRGGGGPNSHMALTLPNGINVESGGAHGTTAYGGPAKGASDFPLRWHLPLPSDTKQGGIVPGLFDGIPSIGLLPAGLTVANNQTGQPEMVLPPGETKAIRSLAKQIDRQPARPDVPDARTKQPLPVKQLPAPIADPREPVAPPPPVAQQPPPEQAPSAAGPATGSGRGGGAPPTGIIAPPSGIDHTLPWVNQAIMSGASTAANIASTAIQAAAAAGSMGASAAGGGMGAGAAGSLVAGGIMQAGKVATKVANVVSSALVGSVPGSFTDTPSGVVMRAEQNRPATANNPHLSGGNTYNISGHNTYDVLREAQNIESLERQARLATVRG
ncbi:hypothetical protein FIV07_12220 [Mycobacterium sp. THAF192]|nr:hypothetical protein FIV07_12220 [Mycobacterium sp. THAF192]